MNNSYLSDEDYDFIYSKVPRICVDLLIKNNKGEVLLTQRTIEPYVNHWHFPGGMIKFRETIKEAVIRIAKSELGIKLNDISKVIGMCEFLEEYQNGNPRHSISIVHEIIITDNFIINSQDKYFWYSEIPNVMIPSQKSFLISNNIL